MNTRRWAILIAVGAIAYMLLMGWQGLRFIASGDPLAMAMGFAVLVLPLLGLWMVWRELQFAGQVQKLANRAGECGSIATGTAPDASGSGAAGGGCRKVQHGGCRGGSGAARFGRLVSVVARL